LINEKLNTSNSQKRNKMNIQQLVGDNNYGERDLIIKPISRFMREDTHPSNGLLSLSECKYTGSIINNTSE